MRIPRVFHPTPIDAAESLRLSEDASHHLARVLRKKESEEIIIFDGSGFEFLASISQISKSHVEVQITEKTHRPLSSPLSIELGQVISRGEKMEFTIQKAVELGVTSISPLISERCGVKLNPERMAKKVNQWQKIAIAACEQCGRNTVPSVNPVAPLDLWLTHSIGAFNVTLDPRAGQSISKLQQPQGKIRLLIGPEGGLSPAEIAQTKQADFHGLSLGPRVLRTETAALTALTAFQVYFGDLN